MPTKACVFCRIIRGELPAEIIAETDHLLAIKDIAPKAPVHLLIIPKKHFENLCSLEDGDSGLAGEMLFMARDLSKKLSGSQAFQLVMNNGADAGQIVFHMHCHFISDKKLADL